ncbi:DUF6157 family protein [Singulisphaera acidiphila]|uniref:DUF6157 family protein n=1 Tax=Singulisphaera acidiphila TaxID=466153 RepID=UPI001ED9815E|nr:DUF6157 family protein [Singulisphaera acidiphila]
MGYQDTFIQVASDCPESCSVVPVAKSDRKPVHVLQYELLSAHPYHFTHEDLLYEVHIRHKAVPDEERQLRAQEIRTELLAKPHCALPDGIGRLPTLRAGGWRDNVSARPQEQASLTGFVGCTRRKARRVARPG